MEVITSGAAPPHSSSSGCSSSDGGDNQRTYSTSLVVLGLLLERVELGLRLLRQPAGVGALGL
eukprot:scaffold14124_cov69-Phaeocystis_antarctica.AAC.1